MRSVAFARQLLAVIPVVYCILSVAAGELNLPNTRSLANNAVDYVVKYGYDASGQSLAIQLTVTYIAEHNPGWIGFGLRHLPTENHAAMNSADLVQFFLDSSAETGSAATPCFAESYVEDENPIPIPGRRPNRQWDIYRRHLDVSSDVVSVSFVLSPVGIFTLAPEGTSFIEFLAAVADTAQFNGTGCYSATHHNLMAAKSTIQLPGAPFSLPSVNGCLFGDPKSSSWESGCSICFDGWIGQSCRTRCASGTFGCSLPKIVSQVVLAVDMNLIEFDSLRFQGTVAHAIQVQPTNVNVIIVEGGSIVVTFRIVGLDQNNTQQKYAAFGKLAAAHDPSLVSLKLSDVAYDTSTDSETTYEDETSEDTTAEDETTTEMPTAASTEPTTVEPTTIMEPTTMEPTTIMEPTTMEPASTEPTTTVEETRSNVIDEEPDFDNTLVVIFIVVGSLLFVGLILIFIRIYLCTHEGIGSAHATDSQSSSPRPRSSDSCRPRPRSADSYRRYAAEAEIHAENYGSQCDNENSNNDAKDGAAPFQLQIPDPILIPTEQVVSNIGAVRTNSYPSSPLMSPELPTFPPDSIIERLEQESQRQEGAMQITEEHPLNVDLGNSTPKLVPYGTNSLMSSAQRTPGLRKRCKSCGLIFAEAPEVCAVEKRLHDNIREEQRIDHEARKDARRRVAEQLAGERELLTSI